MNNEKVAGNTEPRQITTWLPQEIVERVERYYAIILNDTGYGSIRLDIARDELKQGSYQVTEVYN